MAMPCVPGAMFVMVHPDLAFAFLETLLNRPAQPRHSNHLLESDLLGSIAEYVFHPAVGERTAKNHPKVFSRKTVTAFDDTQASELGSNRTLGPFGHGRSCPTQGGIVRQGGYRDCRGLSFLEADFLWTASLLSGRLRDDDFGTLSPDPRIEIGRAHVLTPLTPTSPI